MIKQKWSNLKSDISNLEKDREIARLQKELKSTKKVLSSVLSSPKSKFKVKYPHRKTTITGDKVRVIIPDTHGASIDPDAAAALFEDIKVLNPHEIVMLGDHVDCGGWLAQHHTLGYVAETLYSYEDDISAANQFLDVVQNLAPRAEIHYLEGNHEQRVEKWCITQTLRHSRDSDMLRRAIAPEFKLNLKARGIPYYSQGEKYMNLRVPGTIKLGNCYYWHSTCTAKQAAIVNAGQVGGNVVYGHTHRADSHVASTVDKGEFGAWCPGFLAKIQPYWAHGRPTGWNHGYGTQIVAPSGQFLHLNVPIISGLSLLKPLLFRKP